MYIVFITSLIALILTYFDSKNQIRNGMFWGFVMITTLGVIHYNYGNDYMAYYQMFTDFNKYTFDLDSILEEVYFKDSGWVILCQMFNKIGGFFMMVAVLNIIQNIIVYRFIKSNVTNQWWVMAVFVYLFTTNLYILNFSMMRQGFVVCIFLAMWKYIKERKWWWPLLTIYLCSYIHGSAIILLPFAFWGYLPIRKGKLCICIFLAIYLILWNQKELLAEIIDKTRIYSESLEGYSKTYGDDINTNAFRIGFIIKLIPFILSLYYMYKCNNSENMKLVSLATVSFLITPFTLIIPAIGRLGVYFAIYKLASYPMIYSNIKRAELRLGFVAIFVIMTLYDYWLFFNVGVFAKPFRTFHTIFEVL